MIVAERQEFQSHPYHSNPWQSAVKKSVCTVVHHTYPLLVEHLKKFDYKRLQF